MFSCESHQSMETEQFFFFSHVYVIKLITLYSYFQLQKQVKNNLLSQSL